MRIPWQALEPETLNNLLEEFVSREGTDYGHQDYSLVQKVSHVEKRLKRNELVIVYDHETDTCNIKLAEDLPTEGDA